MLFLREMLIAIARRAGQSERVARYTAVQAASIKAKNGSTRYAGAMSMQSVAHAYKGDYIGAIKSWDYVVKFRREFCGKTSTEYVAAMRDLALLHRLNENTARAKEIDAHADGIRPSAQDIAAAYARSRRPNIALHSSLAGERSSEFILRLKAKGSSATELRTRMP